MDLEAKLKQALNRLETTTRKILETRGYGREAARLRLLSEIIREQLKNEDPDHTTRQVR